jgi:hypothetical protein
MIEFSVQICDPFHTNGFMSVIHQLIEMIKGIFLKPKCLDKILMEEIHLTYGNYFNEITHIDILKLGKFDGGMNYN